MRIALVNNYYYVRGGSERVMFGDQEALESAGHQVFPFAPQDPRNASTGCSHFFPAIEGSRSGEPLRLAKAAGRVVYSHSVGRAFSLFLDTLRPDVIHCHNIYGRLTTAVLDEAKKRLIPTVLTPHDFKLICPAYVGLRKGKPCLLCSDGKYYRCLRDKCHNQSRAASLVYTIEAYVNKILGKYDSVNQFLCPSRFLRKSLIDSGIPPNRCIHLANAVEPTNYDPQFEPGEYALYVGRLSAEKGLRSLLSAIERTNIPLRIAGTGPLEAEIRDIVTRRGLPVRMEGHREGRDLTEIYQNSAFTVVPSEWYENASMSILESLAYGKPVLAANIGGNPELVDDGQVGYLFPSGNIEALSEKLQKMWTERQKLRNMGEKGRLVVEQRHSQKCRTRELISIYKELCSHSR